MGGPAGFGPSALCPGGTSWSLALESGPVLIGPCLLPSVLSILIKTEPSLSLYPPWTVLEDRVWQGAGDEVHVCLGPPLRARTWPSASSTGPAIAGHQ